MIAELFVAKIFMIVTIRKGVLDLGEIQMDKFFDQFLRREALSENIAHD